MMCNNPKIDLINMNAYIKFGEILSICSETKFWRKSRAITLIQICDKMASIIHKLDLVNIKAYIKFGENQSICSRD